MFHDSKPMDRRECIRLNLWREAMSRKGEKDAQWDNKWQNRDAYDWDRSGGSKEWDDERDQGHRDVRKRIGMHAVLVGETLVTSEDIASKVRELATA